MNQCSGCDVDFTSTTAFDAHRVGEFGHNRRCLTRAEMAEKRKRDGTPVFEVGEKVSLYMTEAQRAGLAALKK